MIKDLLVNLAVGVEDDATLGYALSLSRTFNAHLAGIAFAYEAVPPAMLIDDVPQTWIEELRPPRRRSEGSMKRRGAPASPWKRAGWLRVSSARQTCSAA